jgi:predicted hotdog family 3-hydroxylacyl-ACP dehydratase
MTGIEDLIPHAGGMCLLERVRRWDDDLVVASTSSHLRQDNPLRSPGGLHPIHLCEYGAQAMAVHGGLIARRDNRPVQPGYLVSLRDIWLSGCEVDRLVGDLTVIACRLMGGSGSWQYRFSIEHEEICIARGRAAVILQTSAPAL